MLASSRLPRRSALPRAPVLDWSSFRRELPAVAGAPSAAPVRSVEDLPGRVYTTSGRAAIWHALRQLALPAGSGVLVPTYHCPTMVAPILRAGLTPVFFALRPDGLPDLAAIERRGGQTARAMIVAHYFGLPRSLAVMRDWCDRHGIALIEDCAHCFFGQAGERPVGAWGDFATASLSKFLPVPEAGLVASATRSFKPLHLQPQGPVAQLKGVVDVFEFAARHRRFAGLRPVLEALFALKNARQKNGLRHAGRRDDGRQGRRPTDEPSTPPEAAASVEDAMRSCDMARVDRAPLAISMVLGKHLPRERILARRRANFAAYERAFTNVVGARPLFADPPASAAPYVFPLWVDDADRVYGALREAGLPVYRWDRTWPGMPQWQDDTGQLWSHHVLQLLCHQDLSPADVAATAEVVLKLLQPIAAHPVAA